MKLQRRQEQEGEINITPMMDIERNPFGSGPFLHMTALFVFDVASYACIQKDTALHKK